jgi:hypothetical protein
LFRSSHIDSSPGRQPGIVIGEAARPRGRVRPPIQPVRCFAPCTGLPDQPAVLPADGYNVNPPGVISATITRRFLLQVCELVMNRGFQVPKRRWRPA